MFPSIAADINIFFIVFLALGVGIISGFAGVGGGFFVTPGLIIIGFPANIAVGTSLTWIAGNSIIGVLRHRRLGNVDTKLGLVTILPAMGGMEVGVRILNRATNMGVADETVLLISICVLLIVGVYTLRESIIRKRQLDKMLPRQGEESPTIQGKGIAHRIQNIKIPPALYFAKSGVTVSLWIILAIGFTAGVLAGVIGVGGGFIMVPSLIYLVGLPSFTAVGTDLFQIIFSATYGGIRHSMNGNVVIFAAFIMLLASFLGVQFGALVTRYVRGLSVRYLLGVAVVIVAVGAAFKLLGILSEKPFGRLDIWSVAVIFGGLSLMVIMVITLFVLALRYRRGQRIPVWAETFMAKNKVVEGEE